MKHEVFNKYHSETDMMRYIKSLENKDLSNSKSLCILVGPEGDFTPSERESILANPSTKPFTISKNILRSDTAALTAISLVNFISNNH